MYSRRQQVFRSSKHFCPVNHPLIYRIVADPRFIPPVIPCRLWFPSQNIHGTPHAKTRQEKGEGSGGSIDKEEEGALCRCCYWERWKEG